MKCLDLIFFLLPVFCFQPKLTAQNWEIDWEKQLGGQGMDQFTDVIEDIDGGFTVLGSTIAEGNNNQDFWLVRFNNQGEVLWSKTYGSPMNEFPYRLIQDPDKGYLLLGKTCESDRKYILFAIMIDRDGNELWRHNYGTRFTKACCDGASLKDGNFAILGVDNPEENIQHIKLMVVNNRGEILWEKAYGGNYMACSEALRQLPDGGFAIAGQVSGKNLKDPDLWILRTNSRGDTLWTNKVRSPGKSVWPECICCSPDNNMVIAGWYGQCMNDINSADPIFDYDLLLCKMTPEGKLLWTKNIDSEGNEGGNAVAIRPDGKILLSGKKETSFTGKVGPWLLLADKDGKIVSQYLFKFKFNGDQGSRIINTNDGGFVVVGPGLVDPENNRSNGWIAKFKPIM